MIPSYNDLSPEQKSIIQRISLNPENLYAEGPAGSGKTLISLYAIQRFIDGNLGSILFLMYNKSLYAFLKNAMEEIGVITGATINNKDSFFYYLAKNKGHIIDHGASYEKKFTEIHNFLNEKIREPEYELVVVDEIQDMKDVEFQIAKKLGKRIVALGDFAQSIYNRDLTRETLIGMGHNESLTSIFRYHRAIAELAQNFTDKNILPLVKNTAQVTPKIVDVAPNAEFETIGNILKEIAPQKKKVGIITPEHEKLVELHAYLKSRGINNDYYPGNDGLKEHSFKTLNPLLLTSFSAKGLEFAKIILFGFDESICEKYRKRKKLNELIFVSITRTISDLFIIRTPNSVSELQNLTVVSSDTEEQEIDMDDLF